jgi:uncharacterized damage-inducible protein DinB
MDLIEHLRRQFSHDAWANREVLAGLSQNLAPDTRPLRLLAHILSAERLWLERIANRSQSLQVWPDFSFDQCQAQIAGLALLWREYLAGLTTSKLTENVSYRNSKGETWNNSLEEILTHVLLHSSYHRGQIASEMRARGKQPAYTDFIHAARHGLIE